jgi:hypothetical protein
LRGVSKRRILVNKLALSIGVGLGGIALVVVLLRSEAFKALTDRGVTMVTEAPSHYKTGPDEYLKV